MLEKIRQNIAGRIFPEYNSVTRSINKLSSMMSSASMGNTSHFLDVTKDTLGSYHDSVMGLTDSDTSPLDLYDMCQKDTYFAGLYDQLVESLFENEFYIDVVKNEKGDNLGSPDTAKRIKEALVKVNYTELVEKIAHADRADGGGNSLLFTVKEGRKVVFKIEPFLDMGKPRVRVSGNPKTKTITKYEVIDGLTEIVYTLTPGDNYLKHIRYQRAGNYRFSTNPAKRAVYWFILKKFVAGATMSKARNGFDNNTIMSPDFTALTALVNAMSMQNNAGGMTERAEYLKDPIKYLARQGMLDNEMLERIAGNPRMAGTAIKTHMPYKFQTIGTNLKENNIDLLVALCDEQMGYALRIGKTALSSEEAKYSNAEIEQDVWGKTVTNPLKRKIEKITQEYILPVIWPNYDPDIYPVKFGRDPDAEAMQVWALKTERNESTGRILLMSQNTQGWSFNPVTNEWYEDKSKVVKSVSQPNDIAGDEDGKDNTEVEEENGNRNSKKKSYIREYQRLNNIREAALASPDSEKFHEVVWRAKKRQLDALIQNLQSKKTPEEILNAIGTDLPPISTQGLSVNNLKQQLLKFARVGIAEFEETVNKSVLSKNYKDFEYPENILELMDAKSQLMIKGYSSLNPRQRTLIRMFYDGRGEYFTYAGMDAQTSETVNQIVRDHLKEDTGNIIKAIQDLAGEVYKNQAQTIVRTEIAQAVEATRYNMYKTEQYGEKRWLTVKDSKVRPGHTANEADGWIGIDAPFSNGAMSPADEIRCRCTVIYKKFADNSNAKDELVNFEIGDQTVLLNENTYKYYKKYETALEMKDLGITKGSFSTRENTISINPDYLETRRKTFVHEVGHLIDHTYKDNGEKMFDFKRSFEFFAETNSRDAYDAYNEMLEPMKENRLSRTVEYSNLLINRDEVFNIVKNRIYLDDSEWIFAKNLEDIRVGLKNDKHYNYLISEQEVFAEGYAWYKMTPDTMKAQVPNFYNYYEKLNEV